MKLIADSGSTKTDWRIIDPKGQVIQLKSEGINPNYTPKERISEIVKAGLGDHLKEAINEIYYYGSGCGSESNQYLIKDVLADIFPNSQIAVTHDMMAAARALCGTEKGIACILGTGSNSCLFDGQKITDNVQSLGFILGDEGSANWLGKKLLLAYFRRELPEKLKQNFQKRFKMTDSEIVQNLYASESSARFLAQFSKFIFQNIKSPFLYRLVYDSFVEFIKVNITPYKGHSELPIHFTGSVAFYFANILRLAGVDQKIRIQHIVESPIAGLTLYHKNQF